MKRILPIVVTLLMLVGVGVATFATLEVLKPKPEQATEEPAGLAVFAERVKREDLVFTVDAQGEVRPQREIAIAPQISGRISYVSPDFIDGGFIENGQLLVRLEAADYELGMVRAQAIVASAEQRLAREQAEADVALEDLENLGITGASPLARREPQLAEAKANLDSARAQLADAQLALQRTRITAPFSGRVRENIVDTGQFVSPGQSLGQIFATDKVEVVLPITDDELGRLGLPLAFAETETEPGPEVVFSGAVGGQPRIWRGRITRSAAAVNARTRLINVIAELDDPYGANADDGAPMAPGLFVNASIQGAEIADLLVAPRAAIRSGNKLFLGDPDWSVLRVREVDVVYTSPDGAWFRSADVDEGALALVSPVQAAFDGMTITLLERLDDGTIFTHEPKKDGASTESDTEAVAMTSDTGVQ
ncbi:MAG: efflux RND transporter periplasmic adaptor subunit [Pseudomonadota bacterium]